MPTTTLNLGPLDAAIVLRQDGTFETSFPHIRGEYIPENVLLGAALAYALRNDALCALICDNFQKACGEGQLKGQAKSNNFK